MYTIHETSPNSMHMFGLDLEFRLDSFTFGFVYSMCLFALCIMIVSRFSIRILTLDYMYVYMAGPSYGRFRYLWCAFKINLFHFVLWSAKYPYFYLNAPLHFIGGIENVIHYRKKKKYTISNELESQREHEQNSHVGSMRKNWREKT